MLSLWGSRNGINCDGASRRDFLKIGALGLSGFLLPDLLRARAAATASGQQTKNTSVIWLWLGGGPTQVETFDPKMSAPAEYRSTVGAVKTNLPGVEFVDPLGAFYFYYRVDSFGGISGTEFCTRLITSTGVALVPGAAFGDDRWVRLSYAAATEDIAKALDRIVGFAKKLGD